MALLHGKQIRSGSIDPDRLSFSIPTASKPTKANKRMAALTTTVDGSLATSGTVLFTPVPDSYVGADVNGAAQVVGDGVKTNDCYFSLNGGVTALSFTSSFSGSSLFWNGSIAGFQLATSDFINFTYNV